MMIDDSLHKFDHLRDHLIVFSKFSHLIQNQQDLLRSQLEFINELGERINDRPEDKSPLHCLNDAFQHFHDNEFVNNGCTLSSIQSNSHGISGRSTDLGAANTSEKKTSKSGESDSGLDPKSVRNGNPITNKNCIHQAGGKTRPDPKKTELFDPSPPSRKTPKRKETTGKGGSSKKPKVTEKKLM